MTRDARHTQPQEQPQDGMRHVAQAQARDTVLRARPGLRIGIAAAGRGAVAPAGLLPRAGLDGVLRGPAYGFSRLTAGIPFAAKDVRYDMPAIARHRGRLHRPVREGVARQQVDRPNGAAGINSCIRENRVGVANALPATGLLPSTGLSRWGGAIPSGLQPGI
ncbi:hypothetical protein K2X14_09475 [Acetobacter sp. TBRC 12305]|uniref:hypothetical protein n=1 Tax=Acetobacter garciniae TaxID=2817435 RepID=UPI001C72E7B5|nr:hypothetical protein [Acetobacter garciniae]MBX0345062.1 hypothetical protein [Acetobacter garciniae]